MADQRKLTVTERLRQQHAEVLALFEQFDELAGDRRAEVFDCLRRALAVHETAEEVVVYPAVKLLGDEAVAVAEARVAEEGAAKQALADLERLGPDGDGFGVQVRLFRQQVVAHARAEEESLFPLLEDALSVEDLYQMGDQVEVAESIAPTHPHPHGPDSGIGNQLLGPFVAMVDKIRDHLHERASS
jgi:hemerythrin superfamily protein